MSTTSWIHGQVKSKADHFRQGLGRLATTREKATVATKNIELGFLTRFLYSEALRVGGV